MEDWFAAGDPSGAVMIAHRRADVADLNSRARERMRAAGLLGPEIDTPAGTFAVGDHVVVKRNDHRREINNGDRATVTAVAPARGALEIDLRGRRIRLDRHYLAEPTAAGDPPLMHGYAITGHIAQGLTVDDTYVLATDGIDREWAYVALSRGRHSNRLYLTAEADNDRAEYAPAGPTADPMERLGSQLERSSAQVLAIDSGQPVDTVSLEQATLERQRLEHRRFGWLPGRRQELEAAPAHEADVRRARLERRHGGRPFATDAEWRERLDRQHERQLERATERVLRRERGMGREL